MLFPVLHGSTRFRKFIWSLRNRTGFVMATIMATASRSWKTIRPHIPLIKFRKGNNEISGGSGGIKTQIDPSQAASGTKPSVGPYIEDTQLPNKYARRRISEQEIEYINRGGPE